MDYFYSNIRCYNSINKKEVSNIVPMIMDKDSSMITSGGQLIDPKNNIGDCVVFPCNGDNVFVKLESGSFKHCYLIEGVLISIGEEIEVSTGESVCSVRYGGDIEFESSEKYLDYKLLYFKGKREFVIILKNKTIEYIDYYDSKNFNNKKIFVKKLRDMLNHGLVFGIKDNKFEKYLVYLDNDELKLKQEFVPFAFLDCVIAGNLRYAHSFIENNDRFKADDILKFFPHFDRYVPITNQLSIIINKNTPQGICCLDLEKDKISNITIYQ